MLQADFDGDGKPDTAQLLISDSSKEFALFVRLATTGEWKIIERFQFKYFGRYGIAIVDSGAYKTACGKGYGDFACAHGEPAVLRLKRAAIDLFYTESSDQYVYWDDKAKAFKKVLISD